MGRKCSTSCCVGLFVCCLYGDHRFNRGVHYNIVTTSSTAAMFLLGVGGAAEHLVDRLNDGVAVDAKDSEQLVRFSAAWHLGDGQTVHTEASLVHDG